MFHSDRLAVGDYVVDSVWDDSFVVGDIDVCQMFCRIQLLTLLHCVQWWLLPRGYIGLKYFISEFYERVCIICTYGRNDGDFLQCPSTSCQRRL